MIPSKEKIVCGLEMHFNVKLHPLRRKQIFFNGKLSNGKEILVCTPKSKLYPAGHGWVDIKTIQSEILGKAYCGISAFRLEGKHLCSVEINHGLYLQDCRSPVSVRLPKGFP